jgi:PhnB protein
MSSRLNPYISFQNTAKDAMEFYRDVFGGELNVSTFGEYGESDPGVADRVMHAQLETDRGFTLMASDTPPGMERQEGTNISISLSGDDEAELRGYFDKLSEGGEVGMPLEKQVWGDFFGDCTDKFGTKWLVNISGESA